MLVLTNKDYTWYTHPHTDPRTAQWPLMQTPWPTVALCIGYFAMCWVGPSLMEKRKPFELRPILIVYNFALVLLSVYMFLEVSEHSQSCWTYLPALLLFHAQTHWLFCSPPLQFFLTTKALHYTYVCDPVVYSPDEYSTRVSITIFIGLKLSNNTAHCSERAKVLHYKNLWVKSVPGSWLIVAVVLNQ